MNFRLIERLNICAATDCIDFTNREVREGNPGDARELCVCLPCAFQSARRMSAANCELMTPEEKQSARKSID